MKITAVDSVLLRIPTAKPIALSLPTHDLVVATIRTDEGVSGFGYSLVFGGGGAEAVLAYVDTRLGPLLVGEDPLFVERLWEKMFRADRGIERQGIAAYALTRARHRAVGYRRQGAEPAALQAVGRGHRPRGQPTAAAAGATTAVTDLVAEAERYAGHGLPLLQDEDPRPRPAGEPRACRGRARRPSAPACA